MHAFMLTSADDVAGVEGWDGFESAKTLRESHQPRCVCEQAAVWTSEDATCDLIAHHTVILPGDNSKLARPLVCVCLGYSGRDLDRGQKTRG